MKTIYIDYFELTAPLCVTQAALSDPEVWTQLPLNAQRLGEMWQWGSELYTIACTVSEHSTIHWTITPVALPGAQMEINMGLYDAVISTHVFVHVALEGYGSMRPWQRLAIWWRLTKLAQACTTTLCQLLHAQQRVAVPAPVPERVATPVAVPVGDAETATPAIGAWESQNGRRDDPRSPLSPDVPPDLVDKLRRSYPNTVFHFETMGALDHLERIWRLERGWQRILRGEYDPSVYEQCQLTTDRLREADGIQPAPSAFEPDYDLIYAGGGLGLIHAAVMAQCYGWRVLLFDRGEVGCAHREWNISRIELQSLVDMGVVTWEELAPVIMREYRAGLVSFHTGPFSKLHHSDLWFQDVLNIALDAGAMLRLMRRKFEAAGGTVLDHHAFHCVRVAEGKPLRVEVVLSSLHTRREAVYTGRLLVDGMGSTSPLAMLRHAGKPFAGVCPTVGTVASGFEPGTARNQLDSTVGDILISVADTQDGKQMIWEGFPGRGDELTVYVFYYAALRAAGRRTADTRPMMDSRPPVDDEQPAYSLLALFEQYFALLPSYKQPGPEFQHIKPVYGYIPGRHSLDPHESPLLRGVLPVGDSAAQQSPLTYCGFGSHVRNLHRTTSLLDFALRQGLLEPQHLRHISAFQANVSLNWVFSRFMQPWGNPHQVNELQNAFLAALNERGNELATRFFRDRTRWHDYNQIVWYTMMRYKDVFLIAWPVLGVSGVWQWLCDYLRFSTLAAYATGARRLGPHGEQMARWLADQINPALGLQVRAHYAEWRTMGWL